MTSSALITYENGMRAHAAVRQTNGCTNRTRSQLNGTKGYADATGKIFDLNGNVIWTYPYPEKDDNASEWKVTNPFVQEHINLVTGIRKGNTINDGEDQVNSTLIGMDRIADYTGKDVKWEELMITYKVLDNHDGELMPELHVRLEVIRLIRQWNADIVIGHRPNDYHPDHRNTAILVQDAAYMVIVPNIAPDTPPLKKNPVFLYAEDSFQKPYPFQPDIAIDISDVIDEKIYGIAAHESQFFEWLPWLDSELNSLPQSKQGRMEWLKNIWMQPVNQEVRQSLIKWYGEEKGKKVSVAEAFEICEYGRYPDKNEIIQLFPMLNE